MKGPILMHRLTAYTATARNTALATAVWSSGSSSIPIIIWWSLYWKPEHQHKVQAIRKCISSEQLLKQGIIGAVSYRKEAAYDRENDDRKA